jgi:flavin-dependent dehydrogenase
MRQSGVGSGQSGRSAVVIVGGGPGGATLALCLARLGHAVDLVERRALSRPNGESLNPGIWPLLDTLRISDAGALRVHRSLVRWSDDDAVEQRHPRPQLAVSRPAFDARLRELAHAAGVRVAPASGRPPCPKGRPEAGATRITVDATGRSSWSRPTRTRTSERTIAMRGGFRGAGLPRESRVEALEDGWIWGSPMPDGSFAVIACVDADSPADASRYHTMLRTSQLFRDLRGDVSVHCQDATTYAADVPIDETVIRIGDAAHSLDPLSSSGVRSAMQSALHASVVINTILRKPERAALARRFYEDAQRAAVAQHIEWTRSFYGESRFRDAPFWNKRAGADRRAEARRSTGDEVKLADGIVIDEVPCIAGDFVEARRGVTGTARPFVWIGGAEAASLLAPLERKSMSRQDLFRSWRGCVPPGRERFIFDQLVRSNVLTET